MVNGIGAMNYISMLRCQFNSYRWNRSAMDMNRTIYKDKVGRMRMVRIGQIRSKYVKMWKSGKS